ncbi:MAG: Peptidase S8 and S53, subtilisin, kexin, sedolisin [Parcubacteria group bacterium Gr01-1014_13]|nr:MAG: Peptidase S8 and S53, subtilisin, kexin, sedolisin [Parcubacteria group bacterium Gr01-1014_13]
MPQSYLKIKQKASIAAVFLAAMVLVYPNALVLAKVPNDPKYTLQEAVYKQIGAPAAWDYTTGTNSVVVAVIDVGVDINNTDLKENIWQNSKELPDNGIDDDRNGFIDDIHGWNFVENNNDMAISVIQDSDDSGAVSHGTILAGLIGARGDNNLSGTGLNWQIKIMPLRAINSNGDGSLKEVAKAINYAVSNGADIISTSFVGDRNSFALQESLFNARKYGIIVVAAAGNNRNDGTGYYNLSKNKQYPICVDFENSENWILGVTSVDKNDKLSDFANFGACVDISAPGENIYSTQKYAPQYGSSYNQNFGGPWFGSSFAVPLVAGSAALVKSVRPDWGAQEIILDLLATADDIDGLNPGFAGQSGYGRLNVGRAVARAIEFKSVALVFESKLIKKNKQYFVRITSDGKVLHDLSLPGYIDKNTKWAVVENLLVSANSSKGKITVNAWDWDGNKKLTNFVLPGMTKLSDLKIDKVWGDSPNAILFVKQAGDSRRVIIDLPSQSWKTEGV